MITDLKELIEPLPEEEFLCHLRARKPILQRAAQADRFTSLINWKRLSSLLDTGSFPVSSLAVQRESVSMPLDFYYKEGRIITLALSRLLDQGVSLIFRTLDEHLPELGRLCDSIERKTGERIMAGAIITSGKEGAIRPHFDAEDLLILQVDGTKHWQIYEDPVNNPVPGMSRPPAPGGPLIVNETLHPGDWLFLPAGYWHHCENGPGRSLHAGIFFTPPSGFDVIGLLARQFRSDEALRAPLTRCQTQEEFAALEQRLKVRLAEMIGTVSLSRILTRISADREPRSYLDLRGRRSLTGVETITACFRRIPEIPPDPAAGTCTIEINGNRLRFGPLELRILNWLLSDGAGTFDQLAGDLEPEWSRSEIEDGVWTMQSSSLLEIG